MQSIQVSWEDEENNRIVELAVQYRLDASSVSIDGITPSRVHFLCPQTGSSLRSIGVHREKGREVVKRQFINGGGMQRLMGHLEEKHGSVQLA
ncbi:MAG: hypothetical protein KDA61_05280 [Planctomycetales bacterium]|nr:hypothetical protein [Planctomycetales bacterium]